MGSGSKPIPLCSAFLLIHGLHFPVANPRPCTYLENPVPPNLASPNTSPAENLVTPKTCHPQTQSLKKTETSIYPKITRKSVPPSKTTTPRRSPPPKTFLETRHPENPFL